jgi:hypothetical protein
MNTTAQVRAVMHKHKIAAADLIEVGDEDLGSPNFGKAEHARHVGQCRQMMRQLAVSFVDLEQTDARPE